MRAGGDPGKFLPKLRGCNPQPHSHPTGKRVGKGQVPDWKDAAPGPCKKGEAVLPGRSSRWMGNPFKWPSSILRTPVMRAEG